MAYNLKSEEEVKEYINNLGIEYKFGCFKEKNAEVCHLLGDYMEAIKKDVAAASSLYKDNCDERNFGKSCYKYGNYLLLNKTGKGVNRDFKTAYPYFEKGCAAGDPDACMNYGLILVSSPESSIPLNVPKGVESLQMSCSHDNANACYFLSGMFISGVLKTEISKKIHAQPALAKDPANFALAKNMAEAFKYTQMACNLDHMYSCVNLSQMYSRGEGVTKNPTLAEQFKKKALEIEESIKKQQQSLNFQQGI